MPHQNIIQLKIIARNSDYRIYKFDDILVDETRKVKKIKKGDYLNKGKNPIVDQSKDFISGYTDCNDKIYKQYPYILFGDHTRVFKYINFESYLGADGAKIINLHEKYSEKIDIKYIYYFLKSVDIPNTGYNRHFKYVKSLLFPVPPMEAQEKIVKVLDQAQALIDKRKEQIQILDNLIESIFYTMFGDPVRNEKGWEVKKLGTTTKIITGNTPPRKDAENYGDYIEWIKSDNINTPYTYITEAKEYLSKIGKEKGRYVPKDSILMTCIAGSLNCIGNVALTDREVAYNQQINGFIPKEYSLYFLYNLFSFSKEFIQNNSTSSMKGMISKGTLSDLDYIVPPLSLQNDFAQKVEIIEKQKQLLNQSLELLEENYKSIMDKAFKGQLFN